MYRRRQSLTVGVVRSASSAAPGWAAHVQGHRGSGAASAKADTASVWGVRGNSEAPPETHPVSSEFAVPSAVPPESSALDQRRAVPRETTRVPNATQGSYGLLPPPD